MSDKEKNDQTTETTETTEPTETTAIDPDAIEAAEKEADSSGVYVHTFNKPFTYEGKTYDELRFDFDSVNGYGCLSIEQELRNSGITVPVREFSADYQVRFAAKACAQKIGSDVLMALPARDFNRICNKVRSFLLSLGS